MADWNLSTILATYNGSDGDKTKALYQALERCGPQGIVAMNLFRACKCSARAKVYRGGVRGKGSYKSMAYDRKQWSIDNLAKALSHHQADLSFRWGWAVDPKQSKHKDVLYVELPTGQVSFHTEPRGLGPDFPGEWDGVRGMAPERISRFCASVIEGAMSHG